MRLLICGDRNWTDGEMVRRELATVLARVGDEITVVSGTARGADTLGEVAAAEHPLVTIERYPARWDLYGRAAGPKRNQEMLDSGLDYVLAFHDDLMVSKGTRHMVTIARATGVPAEVLRHGDHERLVRRHVLTLLAGKREANWDGEGADPISTDTKELAVTVALKLPPNLPWPEIVAANRGEVDFLWREAASLTIYVRAPAEIGFAFQLGKEGLHGTAEWQGTWPDAIQDCFARLLEIW